MNRIMLDERDSFYKVDEQSILMAEESMEIKFPSELLDFYREIGYGFLKSDFGNVNRIMDPSSIADFRLQRGPYSCDPDVEIYKEFDEKRLVFFEFDSSLHFLIEISDKPEQGIYMFDQKIADSLHSFIKMFHDDEMYML